MQERRRTYRWVAIAFAGLVLLLNLRHNSWLVSVWRAGVTAFLFWLLGRFAVPWCLDRFHEALAPPEEKPGRFVDLTSSPEEDLLTSKEEASQPGEDGKDSDRFEIWDPRSLEKVSLERVGDEG